MASTDGQTAARRLRIRGVVQGVGFRPFVYRLAAGHHLGGWVLNGPEGVAIHAEGSEDALRAFERDLIRAAPPAAAIAAIESVPAECTGATTSMWLEHLARRSSGTRAFAVPYSNGELDYRPALREIVAARLRGESPADISRAFHLGLARGTAAAVFALADAHGVDAAALSGGVFQNSLFLSELTELLERRGLRVLVNHAVPPNDGGISLGQAAIAATTAAQIGT